MKKCLNCGSDDLIEFSDGTQISNEGEHCYNPDEIEDNIRHYDNAHNDDGRERYRH